MSVDERVDECPVCGGVVALHARGATEMLVCVECDEILGGGWRTDWESEDFERWVRESLEGSA